MFGETTCPRCHGGESRLVLTGKDRITNAPATYTISECATCGLWFQNPRPDAGSIAALYPEEYGPHGADAMDPVKDRECWILRHEFGYVHLQEPARRPNALQRFIARRRVLLNLEPRFVEGGLLVEFGSGNGVRLERMRELGWERSEGIEIVAPAADKARRRGLTVHNTTVEEGIERYADRSIDVIVMSMVIEHLLDPFKVIERFAAKLKPGGQLLFSTMVRDRFDARIWGTYWRSLELPRHMVFFTKNDVRLLVAGFQETRIDHEAEAIDFVGSARYRATEEKRLLDSILIGIGERRLMYPTIALSLLGMTSRVTVRAVKPAAHG